MITERAHGLDLIARAYRLIGVVGIGDTPVGDQANIGLAKLKAMLDMWRLERLTIGSVSRFAHVLTSGTAAYTIGPGGAFDVDRPVYLDGAALLQSVSSTTETPVRVFTDQDFRELAVKGQRSAFPTLGVYYNRGFDSSGRGTVTLMETPSVSGLYLVLYLPTTDISIENLSSTLYLLPPGYSLAIEYNLAALLSHNFPGTWTEQYEQAAKDFKAAIMRPNEHPEVMKGEPLFYGRPTYDILRGS